MKLLLIIFIIFYIPLLSANEAMNQEQMMAVQECFSKIDQSSFTALEARGKEMQKEIETLCASGKRDEAMKTAFKYGREFNETPEYQEMRKCSEMMAAMMPNMPKPFMPPAEENTDDGGHICDDM